jgi:hypothetical protein
MNRNIILQIMVSAYGIVWCYSAEDYNSLNIIKILTAHLREVGSS